MQFSDLTQAIQEPTSSPKAEGRKWFTAKVKWFDVSKGYGFVNVKGVDKDIFLHSKVLQVWHFPYALNPGFMIKVSYEDLPDGRLRCSAVQALELES